MEASSTALQAVQFLGSLKHGASPPRGCSRRPGRAKLDVMADGLVLSRRVSERGVHDWAQRAVDPMSSGAVSEYVGYEEWTGDGFLRREVARCGVALILAFGDDLDVHDGEVGPDPQRLAAFVVGNQSHASVTEVRGHQLGVQVELTPAGALALLGDVESYNDRVVPIDEALGRRGVRLVDRLAEAPSWEARLDVLDASFATPGLPTAGARGGVAPPATDRFAGSGAGRAPDGRDGLEPTSRHGALPAPARHHSQGLRAAVALPAGDRRCSWKPATPGSLADVAMSAGYYDQSHLTRDFAALAGMTPGAYAADAKEMPEGQVFTRPRGAGARIVAGMTTAQTSESQAMTTTIRHPDPRLRGHRGGPRLPRR